MIDEGKLTEVLSRFARTMVAGFEIQPILDALVVNVVEILPVSAAGVTLIGDDMSPRYVAGSSAAATTFEQIQSTLAQGPCLVAHTSRQPVHVGDLDLDPRFPDFADAARSAGLRSTSAFPLLHDGGSLGALDLYCEEANVLGQIDLTAASTLADVAACYILAAQRRAEQQVLSDQYRHDSTHDPLTGLPNRVLLGRRLQEAAERATRSHTSTAVFFADVDRFKLVNDAYGHSTGDRVLLEVARRLAEAGRAGDMLARVSGDEFIYVCEGLHGVAEARALAARFADTVHDPLVIDDAEITITLSVGMAFAGPGQTISEQLVERADTAMYTAKRAGGDGHRMAAPISVGMGDWVTLELELRAALSKGLLELAYQPVIDAADESVAGFEALLRWTHPEHGPVPPIDAIRAAEQTDLIHEIGRWTLERACHDHAIWKEQHPGRAIHLAVNVSARQLTTTDFIEMVASALRETGMEPDELVLEITENVVLEDIETVLAILSTLRSMGIRFALDDFGTGYSSMSYLARLPVAILKIDQSFIAELDVDGSSAPAIVEAITSLGHNLGLAVVAEGVETDRQRLAVVGLGIDLIQGFWYSQPIPATAVIELLNSTDPSPDAVSPA